MSKATKRCRHFWLWESFGGMRLYTEANGRKVYQRKCERCGCNKPLVKKEPTDE